MTRKVFYSFHFDNDSWRAGQVRNIGVVDGSEPLKGNRWEDVKAKADKDIKEWINDNLKDKSCLVVLIGTETSERKWVKYEIETAWNLGKAVCGIYIHKLKDANGKQSTKGDNPFEQFTLEDGSKLSSIVKCYNPKSSDAYNDIADNIEKWIEEAISIRKSNNQIL